MNTTYFNNLIMNHTFGRNGTPNTLPSDYYLGLSSTTPTIAGDNVTEPSSEAGYARVGISAYLGNASEGEISNTVAISFPESTAVWGTITHFTLFDAADNGNLLAFSEISPNRNVDSETTLTIKSGQFTLTLS